VDEEGKVHRIDTSVCGSTVGALHVFNRDPAFATARCAAPRGCVAYRITSDQINQFMLTHPDACRNIAVSLAKEVRKATRAQRTSLFEQQAIRCPCCPSRSPPRSRASIAPA
jgi:CRP-like cAMP-binding protein